MRYFGVVFVFYYVQFQEEKEKEGGEKGRERGEGNLGDRKAATDCESRRRWWREKKSKGWNQESGRKEKVTYKSAL